MSLGPVMVDLKGLEITVEEAEMLKHPLVGGVILFARNFQSIEQVTRLIADIHTLKTPHLLVCVDQEGGRVQRFKEGFTLLPALGALGKVYDSDPIQAKQYAQSCGWLMATELRAVGVDFSFAPVLDLDLGISDVIGDRAFHGQPNAVIDLAQSYILGMKNAGLVAIGKHFPGHGSIKIDSHIGFPEDLRSFDDIYELDMRPFIKLARSSLAGIMPAHVIYSNIDPNPAGFSVFWLQDVLRKRLGFQGVIFSDDLSMEAASVAGDIVARVESAIRAGCDMALVCNDPQSAEKVLDNLQEQNDPVAHLRLVRLHGKNKIRREKMLKDINWHKAVADVQQLRSHIA